MPSEQILSANRPPFPTYLLPSLSFQSPFNSFRRRHSSSTSTSSIASAHTLSSTASPISSVGTTPSSSPPSLGYFGSQHISHFSQATTAPEQPDDDADADNISPRTRLGRAQPDTLKCSTCATDLAFAAQIVSKGFTGRHGRAYLVSAPIIPPSSSKATTEVDKEKTRDLVNIKVGRPVNRQLVTGAHVVADISCVVCSSVVGWKYVDANEAAQRYKIGKFILETRRVVGGKAWEDVEGYQVVTNGSGMAADRAERGRSKDAAEEEVEFDSEDEDECDDLFTGVWDAEVVKKRREQRVGSRRNIGEI